MLPLPRFDHHRPTSVDEAIALMVHLGDKARIIAGGTDLLPNMKHGLVEPEHLVSLSQITELVGVTTTDEYLRVGAMTALNQVAENADVLRQAPALAQACAAVGGPHHRRMGTLGGNICLDTRCVYYNQTHFWREALGYCLKKDGTACHVVTSGQKCVAAASNDSAPALMVLQADILLQGPDGARSIAADEFYTPDGIYNTVKAADELVVGVRVPLHNNRKSGFDKLRRRGAIDFPLLNVAVRLDQNDDGTIADASMVVSALAARPKRLKAARLLIGQAPGETLFAEVAQAAFKQCKPLTNIDNDTNWRREMVRVLVRRALEQALAS